MNRKVVFLLPRTGEEPIGGFKIVYEYANRLSIDGYDVKILYSIACRPLYNPLVKLGYRCLRLFRYIKYLLYKNYSCASWFKLIGTIEEKIVFLPTVKNIGGSDIVIATSWITAFWADNCTNINPKNKFYLIQSFEDWHGTTEEVNKTWKMNLHKIVIAPWLEKIAIDLGEKSTLIYNGIDQSEFYLTTPIEEKNKFSASMLWHDNPLKACDIGLSALKIVKAKIPQFTAVFFGVPTKPVDLPEWITYYQMPERDIHREIVYNKPSIFVAPSSKEGWALTVPEAMLCGAAVACTDIDGYTSVAINDKTALTSPVGNSERLADNILKLIENDELRFTIASNACQFVKQFTWERAYNRFKEQLENPDKWL